MSEPVPVTPGSVSTYSFCYSDSTTGRVIGTASRTVISAGSFGAPTHIVQGFLLDSYKSEEVTRSTRFPYAFASNKQGSVFQELSIRGKGTEPARYAHCNKDFIAYSDCIKGGDQLLISQCSTLFLRFYECAINTDCASNTGTQ